MTNDRGALAASLFPDCRASDLDRETRDLRATRVSASSFRVRNRLGGHADPGGFTSFVIMIESGTLVFDTPWQTVIMEPGDIFVCTNLVELTIASPGAHALQVFIRPAWRALRDMVPGDTGLAGLRLPGDLASALALRDLGRKIVSGTIPPEGRVPAAKMFAAMIRLSLAMVGGAAPLRHKGARFARLVRFISMNLEQQSLTPQQSADALGVSLRTLHQTCADHQTSFNRLLIEARLILAAYRLRHENFRVSEAAYRSGFASVPHFCRLIKARYGLTANQIRLTHGEAARKAGARP